MYLVFKLKLEKKMAQYQTHNPSVSSKAKQERVNVALKLAEYKYRYLLAISIVVVLAAAAVLAALYAPEHMPTAITNIVAGLSKTAHQAIFYTAYGVGSVAFVSSLYCVAKGSGCMNRLFAKPVQQNASTDSPGETVDQSQVFAQGKRVNGESSTLVVDDELSTHEMGMTNGNG